MHKSNCLIILAIMVFALPVAALSGEDEATVHLEGGIIESSEAFDVSSSFLKDERVLNLEAEYAAGLRALLDRIQDESDPLEHERLRKEVHQVKAELEIAIKELYLDIAGEQGDEVREMEILEALELLYEPKEAKPASQEPVQQPGVKSLKSKAPLKNPDDA